MGVHLIRVKPGHKCAISDHALIYMTYKASYERLGARIIKTRQMKNFRKLSYLGDLQQKVWSDIETLIDPNDMWSKWKDMLMQSIDKHAPLKSKRIGHKKALWITDRLRREMPKRDFLKKKAMLDRKQSTWDQYKRARNQTNNEIKKAKRKYFTDNLKLSKSNPKKNWQLINELSSRRSSKARNISEIKIAEQIKTEPFEIAEQLNLHFATIGERLASEIPASDIEPETYLMPTETSFSLKAPSLNVVHKLLSKLNERKSAGLDSIPNKLLKMAASIVSPSLTRIFAKSIETGIFPDEWKLARVTPIFKKGKRDDPNNYRPISVIPTVAKIFEKCVCDQLSEYLLTLITY